MKKQFPHKTIKKKNYERSKWDDFNKVKVTFVFKQFRLNIAHFANSLTNFPQTTETIKSSPLTKWLLSLPKTQGRSQQIVRLAFIHNYSYTLGQGTQIASFKNKANPFFNEYLKMQNHPDIGIEKVNLERQKHRHILRYTTEKIMKDYIAKTNQRKPEKRVRYTKKDIKEEERDEFFNQLKKFFNQLVKQPTKEEIAQEYEDPQVFDEYEKEYISENQCLEGYYDSEDDQRMPTPISCINLERLDKIAQIIPTNIMKKLNNGSISQEQNIYCAPSPILSLKSFNLSQFDLSPPLSIAQSEDEGDKLEGTIQIKMKKTVSEDSDQLSFKKSISMDLSLTDQQYECTQKIIANKRRQTDLCDWTDF